MIDRIMAMRVFVRIVDANSFSRAASSLHLQPGTVTRIIQNLEASLGTQLLLRTTRHTSLTSDGAAYYERCIPILEDIDEMETSLHRSAEQLSGHLSVEVPGTITNALVLPALDEFHARYPNIDLSICVNHRVTSYPGEGVDCYVLPGALPDSDLVARRLGTLEHLTCASPQYLDEHGVPHRLEELSQHVAVNCMSPLSERSMDFEFDVGGVQTNVKLGGFLKVSDEQVCLAGALEGIGLIQPTRIAALPYLKSGALREVLQEWKPRPKPWSAVFAKNRRGSLLVRTFVDWLVELFDRHRDIDEDKLSKRQVVNAMHDTPCAFV